MNRRLISIVFLCGISSSALAFDLGGIDFGKALGTLQKAQQASADIDEPKELELGAGIASNLLGAAPLLKNQRVQKYVNNVGMWLALQTERPNLPWRFGVLDDDDVNAFAAPGGYIFVTKGLLAQMRSEAELAGVLAHEMSHILRKHYLEAIKKGARTGLIAEFAGQALESRGADPAFQKLVSAGTEVYARGLDKDDEFEADRMGVVLATRAGYDAYGLPGVLQQIGHIAKDEGSIALLFKTHPHPDERVAKLDSAMADRFDRIKGQTLTKRFYRVK